MDYIKIFGIQRTGTNYLTYLLNNNILNSKILVNELCDKHQKLFEYKDIHHTLNEEKENNLHEKIISERKEIFSIIIRKNPYAWLNSYKKWRIRYKDPIRTHGDIIKDMQRYNDYYVHYFNIEPSDYWTKFINIKYEDVLSDVGGFIKQLSIEHNLMISDVVDIPQRVKQSSTFTEKNKSFYLNSKTYNLNNDEIKIVNDYVNVDYFGYDRINI